MAPAEGPPPGGCRRRRAPSTPRSRRSGTGAARGGRAPPAPRGWARRRRRTPAAARRGCGAPRSATASCPRRSPNNPRARTSAPRTVETRGARGRRGPRRRWPSAPREHPHSRGWWRDSRPRWHGRGRPASRPPPPPPWPRGPRSPPGSTVAFAPTEAWARTTVRANSFGRRRLRGKGSLVKVAFGPTKTSSSNDTPSQSWTPHFTVTRSPMRTSFSTNTWSQMLQSAPMTAPGRTWAKAQILVRGPTRAPSTMAAGCRK